MRKLLWAFILALPVLAALPNQADANGLYGRYYVDIGAKGWINIGKAPPGGGGGGGGAPAQAGPWYLYWPMEAHFQTPAPYGAHYFPGPMTLPANFGQGYGAPSYWYGK